MNIIKRSVIFAGIIFGLVFFSGCSGTTSKVDDKTMPLQKIQLGQFQTKEQLVEYLEKDRRFVELKSISLTYKPDKNYIAGQYEQLENLISKYNLSNAGKSFNKDFPEAYTLFKQLRSEENVKTHMIFLERMVNVMIRELRFAIYRDLLLFNGKGIMTRQEFSARATKAGFRYIRETNDMSDGRITVIFANYDGSSDVKIDRINRAKASEPTSLYAEIFDGKVIRIAMTVASRNYDNRKEISAMTDASAANAAIALQIQLVMQPHFRYSWLNQLTNSLFENDPQIAKDIVAVLNEHSHYSIEFIQDTYKKALNESLIDSFKKTETTWNGYFPTYEIKSGLQVRAVAVFSLQDMRPIASLSVADPNYDMFVKYYMWAGKSNHDDVPNLPIKLNSLALSTQSTINSEPQNSNVNHTNQNDRENNKHLPATLTDGRWQKATNFAEGQLLVWNPSPTEGETVEYSGGKISHYELNGEESGFPLYYAHKYGVAKWYVNGRFMQSDEGTYYGGKRNGEFVQRFADGRVVKSNWENGVRTR